LAGPYGRACPGYSWIPQCGDLIRPFKKFLIPVGNSLGSVMEKDEGKKKRRLRKKCRNKEKNKIN
jgi:hypothetical protein